MKTYLFALILSLQYFTTGSALNTKFVSTVVQPLLDVPTYSLATSSGSGRTAMNILTYATPVSSKPQRMWCISLFKGTQSHENFSREKCGVLQLLSPVHSNIVKLLGGSSSRDVNKEDACEALGQKLIEYDSGIKLLPNCVGYLRLVQVGTAIDCGAHDLVICVVEDMFFEKSTHNCTLTESWTFPRLLSTSSLRTLGIINDVGRVVQ